MRVEISHSQSSNTNIIQLRILAQNSVQPFYSMFQSDCRINLVDRIGENYILKATLDEFDEYRMKKNMSDEMKYKEKVRQPFPDRKPV